MEVYDVDVTSKSTVISQVNTFRYQNQYSAGSLYKNWMSRSSLYNYGNIYRIFDVGRFTNTSMSTSVSSGINNLDGLVIKKDYGTSVYIIQDEKENNIFLFHERIFSDLDFGKPFIFINY